MYIYVLLSKATGHALYVTIYSEVLSAGTVAGVVQKSTSPIKPYSTPISIILTIYLL